MDTKEFNEKISKQSYITANAEMHAHMHEMAENARRITAKINGKFHGAGELRDLFEKLIGQKLDDGFSVFPPFYTDYGKNIHIGKNVFINSGCCFQDQGGITVGDNCLIGHQVVIATLNHDLMPDNRASMIAAHVTLGRNVWIGAHATILAGVTIGDNSVVAAGAVVTKDVPPNVVVGGVPAKIIKTIESKEIDAL